MLRHLEVLRADKCGVDTFYTFNEAGHVFYGTMHTCNNNFPTAIEELKEFFGFKKRQHFYAKVEGARKVVYPAVMEDDKIVSEVHIDELSQEYFERHPKLKAQVQRAIVFIDTFMLYGSAKHIRITKNQEVSLYHVKLKNRTSQSHKYLTASKDLDRFFVNDAEFKECFLSLNLSLVNLERVFENQKGMSGYALEVYNRWRSIVK